MPRRDETEQPGPRVKKRSGELVKFRPEKIRQTLTKARDAVGAADDMEKVAQHVEAQVRKRFVKIVTVEEIQDLIEEALIKNNLAAIAKAFILYRKERQEDRDAKTAILGKVIKTDLSLNSVKLLHERYLLRDEEGKSTESPDQMFERVAAAIAEPEAEWVRGTEEKEQAKKRTTARFKKMMTSLDFLPSTAILVNAGLPDAQLAATMAIPIRDHLKEIFGALTDAVDTQRHGAGTGFNFSNIRERNANVHQFRKIAGGPLQFLHVYNEALSIILQNGRRAGANMAILSVHHPDILEFISAKVKEYKLTNFNISVAATDEFMRAAILDNEYGLRTPTDNTVVRTMTAKQVFDIMVASAWNYADPGILFWDKIERDNPIPERPIAATSPCAESLLNEYECGFLGSLNLTNLVIKNESGACEVDYKRLRETIMLAVRFLDNAIDLSEYPLKQAEKVCLDQRKIGLGVMVFAHLLFKLRIPYDSEEGVALAEQLSKFIRAVADEASFELAKEREPFPAWKKSIYAKKGAELPLRNAARLAISPTGSISIIANASSSIEPVFALTHTRKVAGGKELSYVDPALEEALAELGILTNELIERIANHGIAGCEEIPPELKRVFVTTHEISPEFHVRMQAAWQSHVDGGVSKTVNLPYDATLLDVENVYLLAYKLGCKGVTVYRDGSKSQQVLELTTLIQGRGQHRYTKPVRDELRAQLSNKQLSEFEKKE